MGKTVTNKKEQLDKSQAKIAIFYLIVGLLGIAFIVLAFVLNGGFGTPDPKDYLGTYYGKNEGMFYTLNITEEGGTLTVTNGISTEETVCSEREYVSFEDAKTMLGYKSYFEDLPSNANVIVLKINETQGIYVWDIRNEEYGESTLCLFNSKNQKIELSDERIDFKQEMGDVGDYYKLYVYDANNSLQIYQDNTAVLYTGGQRKEYDALFVNSDWVYYNYSTYYLYNYAIILYDGKTINYIFEYVNSDTLRNGSLVLLATESGGNSGGNGSGNNGDGDIDNGGDSDYILNNWESFFDCSNVTITITIDSYDSEPFAVISIDGDEQSIYGSGYYAKYYTDGYNVYVDGYVDYGYSPYDVYDAIDSAMIYFTELADLDTYNFEKVSTNIYGCYADGVYYEIEFYNNKIKTIKIDETIETDDESLYEFSNWGTTDVSKY